MAAAPALTPSADVTDVTADDVASAADQGVEGGEEACSGEVAASRTCCGVLCRCPPGCPARLSLPAVGLRVVREVRERGYGEERVWTVRAEADIPEGAMDTHAGAHTHTNTHT